MRWTSALSNAKTLPLALEETIRKVQDGLGHQKPDLCLLFVSSEFRSEYESIGPAIQSKLGPRVLLGCSGGGVVGEGREIEHEPALTITAAILPDVTLTPFRVADSSLPDLDVSPREWHQLSGVPPTEQPQF